MAHLFDRPVPMGSDRIEDIRDRIASGSSYGDILKSYPMLTKTLYSRLGGTFPIPKITINDEYTKVITGGDVKSKVSLAMDKEVVIGMLLGDGNIARSSNCKLTHTFSFVHSFEQLGYVKLGYELLKPYVNRIRMIPFDGMSECAFQVLLRSTEYFRLLYDLFYTEEVPEKKNPQKNVIKAGVIELITPRVMAFWVMDDGKRYGNKCSITVGKQSFYTFSQFEKFVGVLSDRVGYPLRAREERVSYEIACSSGLIEAIKEYVWPDFHYKVNKLPDELGGAYRDMEWFKKWMQCRESIKHPADGKVLSAEQNKEFTKHLMRVRGLR